MAPSSYATDSFSSSGSPWRENHGTFLLVVGTAIVLIGGGVMTMRMRSGQPPVRRTVSPMEMTAMEEGFPAGETALLRIRVSGFDDHEGTARVAVFTEPNGFNQTQFAESKLAADIVDGAATWEVMVPANTPVALIAYHDRNDDGQLNRNLVGIPTEEYGFSLGARSRSGPPPFEEAAFVPPAGAVDVSIEIQ